MLLRILKLSWVGCVAALVLARVAQSAVIASGDGTGNTSAPADDFGFANVGEMSDTGLSGVYLGNGWVITANHVGAQPIRLLGVVYQPVAGSGVQLSNPSGPAPDLSVYRINGYPLLPALVLSSGTPAINEVVSCAGRGWTRAAAQTSWNAAWQEGVSPTAYRGYKPGAPATRRWGTNAVSATGVDLLSTRSIETVFDQVGTPYESQAVVGDSGGGCFAKRNGAWELVGIMIYYRVLQGQPVNVAVFGDGTVAADVAYYRAQIQALTPPPGPVPALPAPGGALLAALLAFSARYLRPSSTRR
jgi:hypothetical protein